MKKKILSLCLVVALLATAVIGGTLAYFTDKDQNTNEFTVGGIKIDLWEDVAHEDGAGNEKMTPDADAGKDDKTNPEITYANIMPGDVMKKVVTVENEEDYPVYVALAIKQENYANFNEFIDEVFENDPYNYNATAMQQVIDDIFSGEGWNGLQYTKDDAYDYRYYPVDVATEVDDQTGCKDYVENPADEATLIAVDYAVGKGSGHTYCGGWKSNMTTYVNNINEEDGTVNRLWVYYLYLPADKSYTLDLTVTCPTYIDTTTVQAFDDMVIDVQATAIQVSGFESALAAFEELNETYDFSF